MTFSVINVNCQEYILPDYASQTTIYRLQDAEQEAILISVNEDFTSDDQLCVDLADDRYNEIEGVILTDCSGTKITHDQDFLEGIGVEFTFDDQGNLEQFMLQNIVDESLGGNLLEISIRRRRGIVTILSNFYIQFEIDATISCQEESSEPQIPYDQDQKYYNQLNQT